MMKKQSVGIWFNVLVAVLTVVSLILYIVNISGEGYFKGAEVSNLMLYCILAVIMLAVVIVLAQLKLAGAVGLAAEILSGILRIAVAVLLTFCLVSLISARAEGLGFIYLSNADVLLEVQTPENLSSATGTIANMICLGISAVFAMIAAFFTLRRKDG